MLNVLAVLASQARGHWWTSGGHLVGHLPLNRADHAYALRNKNDIRVPLSRTISFRNSFIPSSIRLWNAVDPSIQNCSSLSSFKRHLRNSNFPKANPLFSYGKGRGPVYHARIRMGLSALNQQRHKYNSYLMHHVIHVTIEMKIPSITFLNVPHTN